MLFHISPHFSPHLHISLFISISLSSSPHISPQLHISLLISTPLTSSPHLYISLLISIYRTSFLHLSPYLSPMSLDLSTSSWSCVYDIQPTNLCPLIQYSKIIALCPNLYPQSKQQLTQTLLNNIHTTNL